METYTGTNRRFVVALESFTGQSALAIDAHVATFDDYDEAARWMVVSVQRTGISYAGGTLYDKDTGELIATYGSFYKGYRG